MGSTRPRAGAAAISLLAATALLVGCGGSDDGAGSTATSAGATAGGSGDGVTIRDYTYEPARITVPKGTTIAFTNRDSTPHTATSKEPGLFESGSLDPNKSGEIVFDESGTFAYYCLFHPFMKGTIVVE